MKLSTIIVICAVLIGCGGGGGDPEPVETPVTVYKGHCVFANKAEAYAAMDAGIMCRIYEWGTIIEDQSTESVTDEEAEAENEDD